MKTQMDHVQVYDRYGRPARHRSGPLRDGEVLHIPAGFADSRVRFADAKPHVMHRPGFVEVRDNTYDAADEARAKWIKQRSEARKTPAAQAGEATDEALAIYQTTVNTLRRALEALGLQGRAKIVGPSLIDLLRDDRVQAQREREAGGGEHG
jgi:hypothetical protein